MENLTALLSTFLHLFQNTYTKRIVFKFLDLLAQLWPFVAAGILITALLTLFFPKERLAGAVRRHGALSLVISALLGAVSPVGTYALIPLVGALLARADWPRPPLVAFMISSPLINPFLFILTMGAFGVKMAVMRLLASVLLGLAGGMAASKLWPVSESDAVPSDALPPTPSEAVTLGDLGAELLKQSKFILKVFGLSLLVAALVSVMVPANLVARVLGTGSSVSVLLAVGLGIPLYACGGGSIPVMEVLYNMGMAKGAVLAFFISGPATKISTLAALLVCIEKRIVLLYLGVALAGAFVFGVVYNLV
jgi:uncharacterized membrane protein YraQ (UPF0718 family)